MKYQVAILVAVYNTSRYLRQCMDSLTGQTLRNIQIIAIDDCSTDDSLAILNEYAEKDCRVAVVQLPVNGGQAKARNEGLKRVDAEYVCMVDSDDWLSTDALQLAVNVFDQYEHTDSVLFNMLFTYDSGREDMPYDMDRSRVYTGYEAFVLSLTWRIHGYYLVKTDIHRKYPYDEATKLYSDDNTTRIHYLHSREVRTCEGIYYYRQHDCSMTHVASVRQFDYLLANESMKKQMLAEKVDDNALDIYENHRWKNVVGIYMFYYKNRRQLNDGDRRWGLSVIRGSWRSIETQRLEKKLRYKPGYIPFHGCWRLFILQEEIYFTLREVMGKNRKV